MEGGGVLTIYASGEGNYIEGGTETIRSGYSADDYIEGGSILYVDSGTAASSTIVEGDAGALSGFEASVDVLAGGVASFTEVYGHGELQVRGGAIYSDITSGGIESVLSGGSEASGTIESGGSLVLASGALASDVYVESGGKASLTGVVVSSGQTLTLPLQVSSAVTLDGVTAAAGATLDVEAVSVASKGTLIISSGGVTSDTVVSNGGRVFVRAAGADAVIELRSGATASVSLGGFISSATVDAGGILEGAGELDSRTLDNGLVSGLSIAGVLQVQDAAVASNVTVDAGGELYILSGGLVGGATLVSGAYADVGFSGTASGLVLSASASAGVYGGTTFATQILKGGEEDIDDLGVANGSVIGSGGVENLFDGGVAGVTTISSGGLLSGAAPVGASMGPPISAANISGTVLALAGSTIDGVDVVSGGGVALYTGATDSAVTISAGGALELTGAVFGSGSSGTVGPVASMETISGATVLAGGDVTTYGAVVLSRGAEIVAPGGETYATVVSSGGVESCSSSGSVASGGVVYLGGVLSGAGSSTSVAGSLTDSGNVRNLSVAAGATLSVASHGSASLITIQSGGELSDVAGALVSGVTIMSNGVLSGIATITGELRISVGGVVSNASVGAGATIADGGFLTYTGAGSATLAGLLSGHGGIIQSGPGVLVASGTVSAFTGSVYIDGGTIELAVAGALGTAAIDFAAGGSSDVLKIDAAAAPASGQTFGDELLYFSAASEAVDLHGQAFFSGASATLDGSTLMLTDGAYEASFTLGGAEASHYAVTSDGAGGTLITPAASPTAIIHAAAAFRPDQAYTPIRANHQDRDPIATLNGAKAWHEQGARFAAS